MKVKAYKCEQCDDNDWKAIPTYRRGGFLWLERIEVTILQCRQCRNQDFVDGTIKELRDSKMIKKVAE